MGHGFYTDATDLHGEKMDSILLSKLPRIFLGGTPGSARILRARRLDTLGTLEACAPRKSVSHNLALVTDLLEKLPALVHVLFGLYPLGRKTVHDPHDPPALFGLSDNDLERI